MSTSINNDTTMVTPTVSTSSSIIANSGLTSSNNSITLETTTLKPHLSSQIFLTSASCQAISGTFAWIALLVTIHHVSLHLAIEGNC